MMLILRTAQIEAMRNSTWNRCAVAVESYFRTSYPARNKVIGDEAAREVVRRAMSLCEEVGATTVDEYCRCVDCIVNFGCDFSVDPRLSYLPRQFALLHDQPRETPFADLQKNLDALKWRVYGDNGVFLDGALTRLWFSLQGKNVSNGVSRMTLSDVYADLHGYYPEQIQAMEPGALVAFARRALIDASYYQILNGNHLLVWLRAALVLGIGFHRDPTLPQIGVALRDSSTDVPSRVVALMGALDDCVSMLRRISNIGSKP